MVNLDQPPTYDSLESENPKYLNDEEQLPVMERKSIDIYKTLDSEGKNYQQYLAVANSDNTDSLRRKMNHPYEENEKQKQHPLQTDSDSDSAVDSDSSDDNGNPKRTGTYFPNGMPVNANHLNSLDEPVLRNSSHFPSDLNADVVPANSPMPERYQVFVDRNAPKPTDIDSISPELIYGQDHDPQVIGDSTIPHQSPLNLPYVDAMIPDNDSDSYDDSADETLKDNTIIAAAQPIDISKYKPYFPPESPANRKVTAVQSVPPTKYVDEDSDDDLVHDVLKSTVSMPVKKAKLVDRKSLLLSITTQEESDDDDLEYDDDDDESDDGDEV